MVKEEHPYIKEHSDFTRKWKYLIIGTFPPKRGCKERTDLFPFFYGNQGSLWEIIRDTNLYPDYDFKSISAIKKWQMKYSIGITDVLSRCSRKPGMECSPSDKYLVIDDKTDLKIDLKQYIITNINDLERLYFTSGGEDNNSNSAYCLFLKLMGDEIDKISNCKMIKLPSPSGEFLRTVFSKSENNYGLKPYFFKFLKANHPEGLDVARQTFNTKKTSPKTRINRKGKTVKNTTKRFPNCINYPSLYRIEKYKELLPTETIKQDVRATKKN